MISLIVCSVNPVFLNQLKNNVLATIGVEHEWLIWDNRDINTGLCEVYNSLAEKAKFPFLCFLHEDLLCNTNDWGKILLETFRYDESIGLIGVAGGKYKSRLYSGWYSGYPQLDYYNITHRENGTDIKLLHPERWNSTLEAVVCIDGVFMVCKKPVWEKYPFNQSLLKGFHFYDIDFSLRVSKHHTVVVTKEIDIVHLTTGGDYGNAWVKEAFVFHSSLKGLLPQYVSGVEDKKVDVYVAKYWLDWLKDFKISLTNRIRWVNDQKLYRSSSLWYSVTKFLVYRPLRLRIIHRILKRK